MKIFTSITKPFTNDEGGYYISNIEYCWTNDGEILMPSLFGGDNGISMIGITTRKATTEIVIKDFKIPEFFYIEMLSESITRSFGCKVKENGEFYIDVWGSGDKKTETDDMFRFNIVNIAKKLLKDASKFKINEYIILKNNEYVTKIENR